MCGIEGRTAEYIYKRITMTYLGLAIFVTIFHQATLLPTLTTFEVQCVIEDGVQGFKHPQTGVANPCFSKTGRSYCGITFVGEKEKQRFCKEICCKDGRAKTNPQIDHSTNSTSTNSTVSTRKDTSGTQQRSMENSDNVWRTVTIVLLMVILLLILVIVGLLWLLKKQKKPHSVVQLDLNSHDEDPLYALKNGSNTWSPEE